MRSQIATTPEQSARLIACGIEPETADMCWTRRTHRLDSSPIKKNHQKENLWIGYPCRRILEDYEQRTDTPAWSLSALLSVLPQRIIIPKANTPCNFMLHHFSNEWYVMYHDSGFFGVPDDCIWKCAEHKADNPIEACVKKIEWLIQNGESLNAVKAIKPEITLSVSQMLMLQAFSLDCSDASFSSSNTERCLGVREYYPYGIPRYSLEDILLKINGELLYDKDDISNCSWGVRVKDAGSTGRWVLCYSETPLLAAFEALKQIARFSPHKLKMLER